jgi:hypothetical protein
MLNIIGKFIKLSLTLRNKLPIIIKKTAWE